jgi:integrase
MAEVIRRVWRSGPRRVRRVAYGYTLQVDGKQVRVTNASWTEEDAQRALAARLLGLADAPKPEVIPTGLTFAAARDRYLDVKEAERKRTRDDRFNLERLVKWFGASMPLADMTAARIAEYRTARAKDKSLRRIGAQAVSAATVNRELATLRHLLRLAADEWQVIDRAPMVRLLREPEGRIRWLEPDEEVRLLAACEEPLTSIVKVALESDMRQGEILGLTWDSVDLTRGVFKLERTKSGRRREVPMRQDVYDILSKMPEPRSGRLWPSARFPRKAFERAIAQARLEDFHFHDCRHHFASWFMMRGGTLPALREILGHRDIKMTLRYAHLAPAHLRVEIEKTAARSAQAQHNGDRIEPAALPSPRNAGVAQRQSN